ncbi:Prophage PSPPH02, putative adenine modification methytransferase [Neorhizobium galegae bv. officinalis bv. officinalis str. HAMBI 1141]|uniref:site-specific DNA-methyltransferase (adenine-specific) n=1 Tax=Neorhizobium galegae bv. officinalis bv. officinalis str. HAMBI 1141 TaxID=1028801 RepID=A0A068T9I8_NEOGA|nr:DNA adenine methylase [Neorhizobium galegae]CDN54696.1 Prophage PSPPH02, putative adenine modification methytransferase [Neorhizobium galegae bv. officinalis bv. officinalis str. HAMBI 1141]
MQTIPASPAEGTRYQLFYGWEGGSLRNGGEFTYQSDNLTGDAESGYLMKVVARSADFVDADKASDTEHFEKTTVGEIVNQIASKMEVINDINGDVANLFRILQRHYPQFLDTLRFQITSRREFDRLARTDPSTLTDLERAARFLYLQRLAFGGKVSGQNFGVSMQGGRFNLMKMAPQLEEIHERMAGVVIENLPWRTFIERYDRPGTLFYLDPPYWGSEDDYGKAAFSRADFAEIADVLGQLKGRFILSLNAVQGVFETFSKFQIEEVDCTYSVGGGASARRVKEVIISNRTSGRAAASEAITVV